MRAPRDGGRRRGAGRGARAHAVSAQGDEGNDDVCTDISGSNTVSNTCENRRKLTDTPACFPADATVQLADGTTKPMRALRSGDKVLDADGKSLPPAWR